jgi:nicotinamide mononucleotide transporter
MNILDPIATLCSLTAAWYASSNARVTWLWSLIAAILNFNLYQQAGVYGHALLDLWYIATSLLGWSLWKQQSIKKLSSIERILLMIALIVSSCVTYVFLKQASSQAAAWDSISFVTGIAAQLCMLFQRIDSWWLWILHDSMNFAVAYQVGLPFQVLKQFFYLLIAIRGYYHWIQYTKKEISIPSNDNLS